jgi:hypothetical protein
MIANLIDISQLDSDQVKHALWPYDLREVLDQMAETLPALIEDKPILFERNYDRELPLIVSHREKLRQILGHLLDNAAKFTESGKISLRACARDEGVEIAVEDTGIGIDAAHQEIIFDGFRQVDDEDNRRYDGMGSASIHRVSGSPGLALPLVSTAVPVLARVSGFGCLIEDRSSSRPPVRAARALLACRLHRFRRSIQRASYARAIVKIPSARQNCDTAARCCGGVPVEVSPT